MDNLSTALVVVYSKIKKKSEKTSSQKVKFIHRRWMAQKMTAARFYDVLK